MANVLTKRGLAVLMIVGFLLVASPAPTTRAAVTEIDSFTTLQRVADPPVGYPSSSSQADPDVLGGIRDMLVVRTGGNLTVSATSGAEAPPDGLALAHSQESSVRGYTLLNWDGHADPQNVYHDRLDVDVTDAGQSSVYIGVYSDDQPCSLVVIFYSGSSARFSQYSQPLPGSIAPPGTTYEIPFSAPGWVSGPGGAADLTHVSAVTLLIDGRSYADLDVTIDFLATIRPPTAVTLAGLTAVPAGNAIQVTWKTASELDNLGFNLYRAQSAEGPRTKLNADLIPGQASGSPLGATYQFVDRAVKPGVTYSYWLEAIDVHGASEYFGPVSATVPAVRRLPPAGHQPVRRPPIPRNP